GAEGDGESAGDEDEVEQEDGGGAEETELLADSGEDVVGVDGGDAPGLALTETGAEDAAGGEGVIGLDLLVAGVEGVAPGVEPVLDADADAVEQDVGEPAGDREGKETRQDIDRAT